MTARRRYERLLRWYPAEWRRINAAVVLDTLEENADRLGQSRPTIGEAWSLRAHGLAERVSPALVTIAAALSLLLSVGSVIVVLSGAITDDPWQAGLRFAAQFVGAFLITAAAGAMLLRRGRIDAEPALAALAMSAIAWAFGAVALTSWGVGFEEADSGASRSWFSNAFPIFAGAAWLLGICALVLVTVGLLRSLHSRTLRVVLSTLLAAPSALALGLSSVMPTGLVLGAAVVLVVAGFQLGTRPVTAKRAGHVPRALDDGQRNRIAVLAAVAAALGIGCAAFALTGSQWLPAVGDGTDAMRVGILGGALVAILTVVAGAKVLVNRRGYGTLGPAAAAIGALLTVAFSYSLSIDDARGWPLLLVAAALTGLTGGLLLAPMLPGPPLLRASLVIAISVALAGALGLLVITAVSFIAPFLAITLLVFMLRRPRQAEDLRSTPGPLGEVGLGRASL